MLGKLSVALTLSVAFLQAASAAELPKEGLVEGGALTYGVAATFAPFEFQKDGTLTGFDIDLIEAIGKKLSAAAKPMNMEFQGLIPALLGSRLDLINSAMYINPKRSEQVDFVPYMTIGELIIVKAGNPSGITGRDDSLCGKTIYDAGGDRGDLCQAGCRALQGRRQARRDGADAADRTRHRHVRGAGPGRRDVHLDFRGCRRCSTKWPVKSRLPARNSNSTTSIGMAVRKGDKAMHDALEAALKEVVADGTYDKLVAKWKLPPTVSPFK